MADDKNREEELQWRKVFMTAFRQSLFQMEMRTRPFRRFGIILCRIAGRVQYEFLDNGCINWDEDFKKMLDAFLQYLQLGKGFDEEDLKTAGVLVNLIKENGDQGFIDDKLILVLCSCAMTWVKQNPEVMAPLSAEYSR